MMTRREFTYLNPDQIAGEVVEMLSAAIARDRRFPHLTPLERDLLFADVRDEIEAGLDEFVCGITETSIVEASNDQ
jgi:hypothetical protein